MSFRRSGLNPLAYTGVEPITLAADVAFPRDPTPNDISFNLSTRWLNTASLSYYVLVNVAQGLATWTELSVGTTGEITSVTTDDAIEVVPDAGNINLFGAHGINTTGSADVAHHTATVKINNTITLGDLVNVTGSPSLTLQTGFLDVVNDNVVIGNTNADANPSILQFMKDRSGAIVHSGDVLGNISFLGDDGVSYSLGSSIISRTSGTIAANRVPSDLEFYTHPDSPGALVQRMIIEPEGNVIINAPDSGDALTVSGNVSIIGDTVIVGDISANNETLSNEAASNVSAFLEFDKSRTGGVITTGDNLGTINFKGHDGTSFVQSAAIVAQSTGTIGLNRVASDLVFYTHPDSNSSATARLRINDTGAVVINAPDSGTALELIQGPLALDDGNLVLTDTTMGGTSGTIIMGSNVFLSNYGTENTFLGADSGNTSLSVPLGVDNTGIGWSALTSTDEGHDNTCIGARAGTSITDESSCTFVGSEAGSNLGGSTASRNVGIGRSALKQLTTGQYNVALGSSAGIQFTTTESSNICIGDDVEGTTGDSNTMRIGLSTGSGTSQLNRTFIAGIRGITTANNNAIAVLVDSAGQLGTVSSSIRFKEDVQDMGEESNFVMKLRPVSFVYKEDPQKESQWGLIAEEVQKIFPSLVAKDQAGIPESVKYHQLPVLLLNELQKLSARVRELEAKIK